MEDHIGQATKAETAEIAKLEATTAVEVDGAEIPFRRTNVEQANESDPERRARLEEARLRVVDADLNPLYTRAHERAAAIARELG